MFDFLFQKPIYEVLIGHRPEGYNGPDAARLALALDHDGVWLPFGSYGGFRPKSLGENIYVDEWGTTFQRNEYSWPIDAPIDYPIKSRADLAEYRLPDPTLPGRTSEIDAVRSMETDGLALLGGVQGPLTTAWLLMGYEGICYALYDDPALLKKIFRLAVDYFMEAARLCVEAGCDGIWIGEDYGDSHCGFMKPEHFRKYVLPPFAELAEYIANLGVPVLMHSCGHITEYLAAHPDVRDIMTFDTDPAFAAIARLKVEEMGLSRVREVRLLSNDETRRLPYPDRQFDLVLVLGVVEHLPVRGRRQIVDEYYRVLAPGGHIAILDTPNRFFPLETHSVGLPLVQWLPAPLAFAYAKLARPGRMRGVDYAGFVMDGTGWRNASLRECLPSSGWRGVEDVTEEAGFGWAFFRDTARSRTRRGLLPAFSLVCRGLHRLGLSPSLALPYLNLVFRKRKAQ